MTKTGEQLSLSNLTQFNTVEQAANSLFESLVPYSRIYGGAVSITETAQAGALEYTILWKDGVEWANPYSIHEDATTPEFILTSIADGKGVTISER